MTEENIKYIFRGGHSGLYGSLASKTTDSNDYAIYKDFLTPFTTTTVFHFSSDGDLYVKILGDLGDGSYETSAYSEFTVSMALSPVEKIIIGNVFSALRIMLKPHTSGVNATLNSTAFATDVASE